MSAPPLTPGERRLVEAQIALSEAHRYVRAAGRALPDAETLAGSRVRHRCRIITAACLSLRWRRDEGPAELIDEVAGTVPVPS